MRPITKNSSVKSTKLKFSMAEAQAAVDRFSELPPEVAHHILAFLPIADVTRVSCLSKRCRGLHLSNPTLNFNSFPSESTLTFDKRLEMLNSLDRFLIQRGNSKVKHFFLHWTAEYQFGETDISDIESRCSLEKSRILGWIHNAVSSNVEELNVSFRNTLSTLGDFLHKEGMDFPSSVFLCPSLRYLRVNMRCAFLKAPSFSTSPTSNLLSLRLENLIVEDDEDFCKWISYYFRFIKELALDHVYGLEDINIESSSLESFSVRFPTYSDIVRLAISGDNIEDIDIYWQYNSEKHNNESILYISAPNLKNLKWDGNLLNHQHLGEMNCLERVEISLTAYDVDDLDSVCEEFKRSIRSVKKFFYLIKSLPRLCSGKVSHMPHSADCKDWYLEMCMCCTIDDNLLFLGLCQFDYFDSIIIF